MMEGARGTIEAIAVKNLQEVLRKKGISAEALFSKYDLNGDGSLSSEEFKAALESVTGQNAPEAILRAVFGAIDTNSDGKVDLEEMLALLETGSSEGLTDGDSVSISGHPNDAYNGTYELQDEEINDKPWYKNAGGNRLYFYNAASGGAPSWSLDDRGQDGSNDWYRGGWSRPRSDGSLPTGTRRWVGVGKITISSSVGSAPEDDTTTESAAIAINLPKSSFKGNEGIDFTFVAPELPDDAWVGIVPAEIPHGDEAVNDEHETSFKYLEGRTRGAFTLPSPGAGQWTLRLHDTDDNGRELAYAAFTVEEDSSNPFTPPSLSAETGRFAPGFPITVSFSGASGEASNWIGIYRKEAPSDAENHHGNWLYVNGSQVVNEGLREGSVTFPGGMEEGDYEARLFASNGYGLLASTGITVSEGWSGDFDEFTSNFDGLLSNMQIGRTTSIEDARALADAEVESQIGSLPFSVQGAARRIWRAKADATQARIVAGMPSPEALAAGAAAAGVAGAVAAGTRNQSQDREPPLLPPEIEPEPEEQPRSTSYYSSESWHEERHVDIPDQVDIPEHATSSEWHEEHHVDIPDQVNIPDQVDIPDRSDPSDWYDSHRVGISSRVSVPDRVSVSPRGRASAPSATQTAPDSISPSAASVEGASASAAGSLADIASAFIEARMLSDQRRLVDSYEGQPHDFSMKVSSAAERTFGIGIDDAYRGGSTILAEVPDVGKVEIRLRNDVDAGPYRVGSEHSLTALISGWNGIHKRLILSAQ